MATAILAAFLGIESPALSPSLFLFGIPLGYSELAKISADFSGPSMSPPLTNSILPSTVPATMLPALEIGSSNSSISETAPKLR